jgi:plastocyanin
MATMRWAAAFIGSVVMSLAWACSDSTTSPSTPADAGTTSSSSGSSSGAPVDSGADTGGALNGCTTFVDRTADDAERNLKWDLDIAQAPARCMKIKVGQSLKLSADGSFTPADLGAHPVEALGGDEPSPFTDPGVDAAGNVVFDKAGSFGFGCEVHGTAMTGVILVVQ